MAENEGSRPDGERRGGQGGRPGGFRGGRSGGGQGGRSGARGQGGRGGRGGQGGQGGRRWESRDDRGGDRREGRRDERGEGREGRGNWGGDDRRRGGDREWRRDDRRDDRRGGSGGPRGDRRDDRRGGPGGPRGDRRDDRRGGPGGDRRGGPGGDRRHSNRGGRFQDDQKRAPRTGPQRPGFREERIVARQNEPSLPEDVQPDELDPSVRQDLRSLSKDNADQVARHMIMAATLMADDPKLALRHARAAKDRAGRVGVVRETNGVAAYHAGEWKEALAELRAARRISGGAGLLAVMADCERGLGRPEKAIELGRSDEVRLLDDESRTELAIVVAGARRDMGDLDAAIIELEAQDLDPSRKDFEGARLFYAYADALAAAGRTDEAREWFNRSADLDPDGLLDAGDRAAEL
ncbi:hypothetical protein [Corynebacterium xerosis]|uniref:Tetratricopeptide repeat protein n=1 Tax=Corynebacterium xerosis TaxID=1725 RepID=A0A7X9STW2_9CORY|nr:hypothetical protein [Corynebacterium xerosis]NMF08010.1 hypothetical protein [Corynebacterium xerosis]